VSAAFAADPTLDFVYGDALEIDQHGNILTPNLFTEDCDARRFYTSHDYICQPTLFVRRSALARVGPIRRNLRWFLDYDWFGRFFEAGLRGQRLRRFNAVNRDHPSTKTNSGGFARWWEIMQVLAERPGPFLVFRRCCWIYSLEFVIKQLTALESEFLPAAWKQAWLDRLHPRFMRLVSPRSFHDIVRQYERDIQPHGRNLADLWDAARAAPAPAPAAAPAAPPPPPPAPVPDPAPPSPPLSAPTPAIEPLAPVLEHKFPGLIREAHAALRTLLFPDLPAGTGREDLLAQLLGTSVSEATYVLASLHRALAVPGDVVEFGIAQGATSALLANELRGTGRVLWLYDSFAGLPAPTPEDRLKDDIFGLGAIERYRGEMACPRAEVEERLRRIGIAPEAVRIVPGFIDQTLPRAAPDRVAFAYVDFDFYAPIREALDFLDRTLSPGGWIVVDDYDFFSTGAKQAVDEFVARRGADYEFSLPHAFAGHFCLLRRRA
jgi:O-methyltransferase